MASTKTYRIASLPGDGIGVEVIEQAVQVLEKIEQLIGTFTLQIQHFDWSSSAYKRLGEYIPDGGLESLKTFDAILFGAVGSPGTTFPFISFRAGKHSSKGSRKIWPINHILMNGFYFPA
jgi:isocitrate/isopropylmalate dehydrogenase